MCGVKQENKQTNKKNFEAQTKMFLLFWIDLSRKKGNYTTTGLRGGGGVWGGGAFQIGYA